MSACTADGVALERMGVPAAVVGVDLLVKTTGKATARLLGVPNWPFVVLPAGPGQPFADLTPQELRSRVLDAVGSIVTVLTGKS
jgi:hypothetical protein